MNSRLLMIHAVVLVLSTGASAADNDGPLPETPTAFETRNTGGNHEPEADFRKNRKVKPTKVKFTALTDPREWHDAKGKAIRGRLLAFEAGDGKTRAAVQNGKVRLLVDGAKKFSLLSLDSLSREDQMFVRNLIAVRNKAAAEPE